MRLPLAPMIDPVSITTPVAEMVIATPLIDARYTADE
jgi:hypothetical protein